MSSFSYGTDEGRALSKVVTVACSTAGASIRSSPRTLIDRDEEVSKARVGEKSLASGAIAPCAALAARCAFSRSIRPPASEILLGGEGDGERGGGVDGPEEAALPVLAARGNCREWRVSDLTLLPLTGLTSVDESSRTSEVGDMCEEADVDFFDLAGLLGTDGE